MRGLFHFLGLIISSTLLSFNLIMGFSFFVSYLYFFIRNRNLGSRLSKVNISFVFLVGFIVSDLISLVILNAFGYEDVKTIFFQGVCLVFIILYCINERDLLYQLRFSFLLFALIAFLGLIREQNITAVIAYIKSFWLLPIICFQILYGQYKISLFQIFVIITLFAISIIMIVIQNSVGFENYFIGLGIDKFYASRGISTLGEIPIGFVVYDPINDEYGSRPFGVFLSPDKMAYLAGVACCLVFSRFINGKSRLTTIAMILTCMFFTIPFHVKTFSLFFVVVAYVLCLQFFLKVTSFHKLFFLTLIPFSVSIYAVTHFVPASVLSSSGAIQHLWGLLNPIYNSSVFSIEFWLGNGLGAGGTVGRVYADNELASKADVGGESFIGSTFYQIGFYGVALIYYIYSKVNILALNRLKSESYPIFSASLLGIMFSMSMSEAFVSFFQSACLGLCLLSFTKFKSNINK